MIALLHHMLLSSACLIILALNKLLVNLYDRIPGKVAALQGSTKNRMQRLQKKHRRLASPQDIKRSDPLFDGRSKLLLLPPFPADQTEKDERSS